MSNTELMREALSREDEFSRSLAQARMRLGYLGFENLTNKELLLLSYHLRRVWPNGQITTKAKEAVCDCFFDIVGYHIDELDKDAEGQFTSVVKKLIAKRREKYNNNDDPSSFEEI